MSDLTSPPWTSLRFVSPSPLAGEGGRALSMIDDLYSAKVLALAANMPRLGRLGRAGRLGGQGRQAVRQHDPRRTHPPRRPRRRLRPGGEGLRARSGGGVHPRRPRRRRDAGGDRTGPGRLSCYVEDGRPAARRTFFGSRHARPGEGLPRPSRLHASGVRGDGRGLPRGRRHENARRELAPPTRPERAARLPSACRSTRPPSALAIAPIS